MTRILSILFLITAVVLVWRMTIPYWNDIKTLSADKAVFDDALANSRELQSIRDDLLSKYNTISQSNIGWLNKMLPSQFDPDTVIVMLENRIKAHGLLLKRVNVKEAEEAKNLSTAALGIPPPPYKTITFSASVSGPYSSFLAFLSDLEKSLRLIDVGSISFSSASTDVYEFNIEAKTYYAPVSSSVEFSSEGQENGAREISSMLTTLKNIEIDLDFFNNDIFQGFLEFFTAIETPSQHGRANPFLPVK